MRRLLALLVALIAGASAIYVTKNPEKSSLDATARRSASRTVQLADGYTHYDISGPDSGQPVVLVHGFSVPSYIWDSTAVSGAGYRVIRYDVYGRGWSDRPDAAYDGALFDRQLDGLLDSLHVTVPIFLPGAPRSAASSPGTTSPATRPAWTLPRRPCRLVDPRPRMDGVAGHRQLGHPAGDASPGWRTTRASGLPPPRALARLGPSAIALMHYKGFGRALLRSAMTSGRTDFDSLYAAVRKSGVPVLLVWGRQDTTVPIEKAEVLNAPSRRWSSSPSTRRAPPAHGAGGARARAHQGVPGEARTGGRRGPSPPTTSGSVRRDQARVSTTPPAHHADVRRRGAAAFTIQRAPASSHSPGVRREARSLPAAPLGVPHLPRIGVDDDQLAAGGGDAEEERRHLVGGDAVHPHRHHLRLRVREAGAVLDGVTGRGVRAVAAGEGHQGAHLRMPAQFAHDGPRLSSGSRRRGGQARR
ncbi:MAG: alpha/beta hydrolase [Gemmatimonadaceae bacterium]